MARMLFVAVTLIAVLLIAIGLRLASAHDDSASELQPTAVRSIDQLPELARGARLPEPAAVHRELVAKAAPLPEAPIAPSPRRATGRILVHGQVRGGGGPVDDFDLSFAETGTPATDTVDWDFTDEEGRYEVELAAGSYAVHDAEGRQVAILEVTADSDERILDLFVSQ